MPKGKPGSAPEPPAYSYVPPEPPRAIIVSVSTMAFASAVYQLDIDPSSAWRAVSIEQAHEMQRAWAESEIASYIVPLPEMLREVAFEDDDVTDGRHQTRSQAAA